MSHLYGDPIKPNASPGPHSCHPNPCRNGGICTSLRRHRRLTMKVPDGLWFNKYHCKCPPEFTGKNCEQSMYFIFLTDHQLCRLICT